MKRLSIILITFSLFSICFTACKVKTPEEPKAVNVIFMIGDGTALPQVYASMLASHQDLAFCKFPYIGIIDTHSASHDITDSAAGGTALCCDKKTKNRMIGMDADSIPMETVLEVLHDQGKSTGVVATSYVTHATPASFVAKVPKRTMYEEIAVQMAESEKLDLMIGGGMKHFNQRSDSVDLVSRMETELGWKVYKSLDDIDPECTRYAVMANDDHMPIAPERGDFLPEATKKAIATLEKDPDGFFLMVEGSQIDFACHANDSANMVDECVDFSKAIDVALAYAQEKGNTLVIVTADHETGGLTMPDLQGKYTNVSFSYSTTSHTCLPVIVYAYGPGAEQFTGWMQNTAVKGKILHACGLQ